MHDDVAWQSRVTQSLRHVFVKKLAQEDFGCGVSVGHIWDIKRPQINSKIENMGF